MQPSYELKDLMARFYEALTQGEMAFVERLISTQDHVLLIGTDPNEWMADLSTIMKTIKAQAQAGIQVIAGDLQAYREGTVGWVADRARFVLPDGTETPFRWTAVLHQEGSAWKLVQGHASIGVANEEAIGTSLNV